MSIHYLVNMFISYICNPSVAQSIELAHSTQFRQLLVRNCCQCSVYMQYTNNDLPRVSAAPEAFTPCLWPAWAVREWIEVLPYHTYGEKQPCGEPPPNMKCARDNVRYIDTHHMRSLDTCTAPRGIGDCVTFWASLRHVWCWKLWMFLLQCNEFFDNRIWPFEHFRLFEVNDTHQVFVDGDLDIL